MRTRNGRIVSLCHQGHGGGQEQLRVATTVKAGFGSTVMPCPYCSTKFHKVTCSRFEFHNELETATDANDCSSSASFEVIFIVSKVHIKQQIAFQTLSRVFHQKYSLLLLRLIMHSSGRRPAAEIGLYCCFQLPISAVYSLLFRGKKGHHSMASSSLKQNPWELG